MRPRLLMLAAISILLLSASLAHAQLAINVPVPPETMTTETTLPTPPSTAEMPVMGSSPGGAAGVPDPSTTIVYSDGVRQRVKVYADNNTVRAFDPAEGLLSLQDGTEVTFPQNFAFLETPQPGHPVTIYYFIDRNGKPVLSAIDMGLQGGGDSGGGS